MLRRLVPEWGRVREAWGPCESFLKQRALTADVIYGLCMAAQELLENAVKYGSYTRAEDRIELAVDAGQADVIIEVKHPVARDPSQLRRFDESIQWIRGFQSPFEAYVERLKNVSAQPYETGKSGLGLARIAFEARCILDFYVDENDILAVSAVYQY